MQQAHLFVAVLGASSYTYSEATADEQLESWISTHVRARGFDQGVPKLVVPDNTKTGITEACCYGPDLNPTYQETAMHYGRRGSGALRPERMVPRPSQHRLTHRFRQSLLQRPVQSRPRAGGRCKLMTVRLAGIVQR